MIVLRFRLKLPRCEDIPRCVNEATNIQTTVIDNRQQFMHIHSTGLTAPCPAVPDPQQEVQQTAD